MSLALSIRECFNRAGGRNTSGLSVLALTGVYFSLSCSDCFKWGKINPYYVCARVCVYVCVCVWDTVLALTGKSDLSLWVIIVYALTGKSDVSLWVIIVYALTGKR